MIRYRKRKEDLIDYLAACRTGEPRSTEKEFKVRGEYKRNKERRKLEGEKIAMVERIQEQLTNERRM